MVAGTDHIVQSVPDIRSADQLLSYATSGQLARILMHRQDLSQAKIAHGAGFGQKREHAAAALSTALRKGPTAGQLIRLDQIIGALAPDLEYTGGLCSLAVRLSAERQDELKGSMTVHMPSSWTSELLKKPSPNELDVLVQAAALLGAFEAAENMNPASRAIADIRDRYQEDLTVLVRRLILISVGPPTAHNVDAAVMLGSLARYAFQPMKQQLERELRQLPLGFRVWRAIAKLVKLGPPKGEHNDALRFWVQELIRDSNELRKISLYAGAGLDLELAITVPSEWSPPSKDWVGAALLMRARNAEATLRERGTAAMGLWERVVDHEGRDRAQAKADLRELIAEFRGPEARPDIATGLRWVASTLEEVIERHAPVLNEWPSADEPWLQRVQTAADELDNSEIPEYLQSGTKSLFRHMILQNAGLYRRNAIETVVASGWNEPVTKALGRLLKSEQEESWIRIRALSALGFLRSANDSVETDLIEAARRAYANLKNASDKPTRAHITEMHSALFAIGDCFGVPGAEDHARSSRENLRDILTELATLKGDAAKMLRRATRAASYMLVVSAQARRGTQDDLSEELLKLFSEHPDPVTSRLSSWALSFRFASDATVRPLLAAAEPRI
jgi:hypothetical protein